MNRPAHQALRARIEEKNEIAGAGPVLSRVLVWLTLGGVIGLFWRELGGLVVHLLR